MGQLCTQLFETGLAEHKRREAEVSSFFRGREEAVTDCQEKASQMLTKFNEEHREASRKHCHALKVPFSVCAQMQ